MWSLMFLYLCHEIITVLQNDLDMATVRYYGNNKGILHNFNLTANLKIVLIK